MAQQHVGYLVNPDGGISVYIDGRSYVIGTDHPSFAKIKELLKAKQYDQLPDLLDVVKGMQSWLSDDKEFEIKGGLVYLNGEPFSDAVSDKVIRMMQADFDPSPLLNFLRKVRKNPSFVAQQELLLFCIRNGFLIHEDGDIIAYKGVKADYTDHHTGTIDNTPPKNGDRRIIEVPRYKVDDRRENTCSYGLHFATYEYAQSYATPGAAHMIVLKIHPADVVSIPNEAQDAKGRCCKYEVIGEREDYSALPQAEVYRDGDINDGTDHDEDEDDLDEDDGVDAEIDELENAAREAEQEAADARKQVEELRRQRGQ